MTNYFLFLDELKTNKIYEHFCIGGCFIEETYYRGTVVNKVNEMKNTVFCKTSVILHENEVRSHSGAFSILKRYKEKEEISWNKMKDIIV